MKTCCICNEKRMFEITQIYSIPELLSFANEEHICSRCWEAIMCLVYLRKQDPEHFRQGYPAFFHQKNKVDYIAGKVNGIQNLELRAAIQSRHAEIMALYDEYSIEGEAKLKGEVEARQALRTARWNDFLANHPEFASTRKTIQVEKRLYHRKTIESAWNFDGLGRFTFFLDFGIDSGYLYFGDNDQKNPGEFSIGVSGLKARIAEIDKELKKKDDYELFGIKRISIDSIVFFREIGDVQYTTEISGGGGSGGGINTSGAVLGGMLFGEAGAIVGSRVGTETKINPIKSSTKQHDTRLVSLRYQDGEKGIKELEFDRKSYPILLSLIPEKEYLQSNLREGINKQAVPQAESSPIEKIKQLKELLDAGIITQQDFDEQKARLLGSL